MDSKLTGPIVVTALITAVVVGAAFFFLGGRAPIVNGDGGELEEQVAALEEENEALEEEVAALNEEVTELREENEALREHTQIHREPKEGWEQYFPDAETTTLEGEPIEDVRRLLGEPPFLVRSTAVDPQNSREVWVYTPFADDPTGLYLFFSGGRLEKSRLDEFPGLRGSFIWDDEDFWQ